MVYTRYGGLVLAEHGADETAIRHALKGVDRDLRLVRDDREGRPVYRVFKFMGESTEAAWVCDWRDDSGNPLPLTHRLVEKVSDLRLGSRAPETDPAGHNDRLREQAAGEFREALDDQVRDGVRRAKRAPCFKPSQSLRMARDKQRRKGHNL
jgi:hypothetical protein